MEKQKLRKIDLQSIRSHAKAIAFNAKQKKTIEQKALKQRIKQDKAHKKELDLAEKKRREYYKPPPILIGRRGEPPIPSYLKQRFIELGLHKQERDPKDAFVESIHILSQLVKPIQLKI